MRNTFTYGRTHVRDMRIVETQTAKLGKITVTQLEVAGEPVKPTQRFWKSFFARFGVTDNVFRYFSPDEVFERVSERARNDEVRYCLERDPQGDAKLLAVSNPKRPIIREAEVNELVERHAGDDISYESGVITSTHTPRSGEQTFQVGGDDFQHRFVLETPIDGFSQPRIFVSFLRLLCANGAIGYSRAFRSDISLGSDLAHCIGRALETFDNGDGYAALRQRFTSAQHSWASVHECLRFYKVLVRLHHQRTLLKSEVLLDFYRLTGNLHETYGLANLDALSVKRQRVLPAKCRVYDLLNFASELATHHATATSQRTLQAFIGGLIADEYDLEGTAESVSDFADFFVASSEGAPAPSLN
ncbi:MAG TPA: DUF932 domain-containing protein [Pirellulaceae bacterium]|nr:DUF932 domain-containing protein [Pirellulaceae bacterium]